MAGAGFCFLDPHGDASQQIASRDADRAQKDVIYLDPSDPTHTFAYNPLSGVAEADRATAAANIVSAFKNIWAQSWGPRLEYILDQLAAALARRQGSELARPPPPACRRALSRLARSATATIRDPIFWQNGIRRLRHSPPQRRRSRRSKTRSAFCSPTRFIRSILCQNSSTLDIARRDEHRAKC